MSHFSVTDAHHGNWSRRHIVLQVNEDSITRALLPLLTVYHRHQMVLPPDSIADAVKPINSMQVTCAHFFATEPPFFYSLSARLKDSVFEVREKALVALRGTLI